MPCSEVCVRQITNSVAPVARPVKVAWTFWHKSRRKLVQALHAGGYQLANDVTAHEHQDS